MAKGGFTEGFPLKSLRMIGRGNRVERCPFPEEAPKCFVAVGVFSGSQHGIDPGGEIEELGFPPGIGVVGIEFNMLGLVRIQEYDSSRTIWVRFRFRS